MICHAGWLGVANRILYGSLAALNRTRTSRALAAICLFLLVSGAHAQITTGSISGFVTDPSAAGIPRAAIVVTRVGQDVTRETIADQSGFYRLDDLAPGRYDVAFSAAQFSPAKTNGVEVRVDSNTRVDARLKLPQAKESVSVSVSRLATDSSELGAVLDQNRIETLPLNERDFLQLAFLTAGVMPPVEGSPLSTRGGIAMEVNGGREEFNNFMLDGVDNNDFEINRYVLQPSVDSIQEFKIDTSTYSAAYGRSGAGQVNVVTRSGSNEFHGFAYEYLRNRDMDARNFFDGSTKPGYTRSQFGSGLGGPVRRDKTFFFFSFDGLEEREGLTQIGTTPTAAERAGNFAGSGQTVIDPFTQMPFPGDQIPQSRIDPLSAKILALYPLPNLPGESGNYLGQPVQPQTQWQYNARMDHHFSPNDTLTLRYSYGRDALTEPYAESNTSIPGFGDVVQDSGHNALIEYAKVFSPTTLNSLLLGFNRATRKDFQENYQTNVNTLWGVNWLPSNAVDYGYPSITVSGYSPVGDVTELPIDRAENTYQITDGLTMIRGNHSVKVGIEERKQQHNGIDDIYTRGSLAFDGTFTGTGLGDVLLGYPTFDIQAQSNNVQTLRSTASDSYVQDDWKVLRNLTLNFGLRYEFNTPATDPTNRMSVFDAATDQVVQVGTDGISRSGYSPDTDNFAPRVGFAWDTGHNLVVRGGYGIYYDSSMAEVSTALYFNPPYFTLRVFFPSATSLLTLEDPFPTSGGLVPAASLSTLSPNLNTAYLQQWNLNLQREFWGSVVTAAYAASKGTHLLRSLDLNQPPPAPGDIDSRRPYPNFSNIFYTESGGDSEYQSFNLTFNHPLAHGVSILGVYTFSKSMDDTSSFLGNTADKNFPQDSQDFHLEHALSSFDVRHRAEISAVWNLPGRSRLTRNFQASTILTAETGQPFTPILLADNSNTGNIGGQFGSDRPNLLFNPTLPNPSVNEWFNTAAFAIPPAYTFGDAGRNIVRGPGLFTVDLSLLRQFAITERVSLSAQAEAFNLLNRANFNLPDLYADQPSTFGHIYSAKAPRQIQLALRLRF